MKPAQRQANADRHAANVLPIIAEIQKSGATTLRAIAEALNARGIPTPRGRKWEAMSVKGRKAIAARLWLRELKTHAFGCENLKNRIDDRRLVDASRLNRRISTPL